MVERKFWFATRCSYVNPSMRIKPVSSAAYRVDIDLFCISISSSLSIFALILSNQYIPQT